MDISLSCTWFVSSDVVRIESMGADLDGASLTVWSRALGLELEKSWSRKLEDSGFGLDGALFFVLPAPSCLSGRGGDAQAPPVFRISPPQPHLILETSFSFRFFRTLRRNLRAVLILSSCTVHIRS